MDGSHRWLFGLVCLVLGAGCAPMLDEPLAPPGPPEAPPPSDLSLAELPGPVSDVPPPAPRLRRTKTLGQSDDSFARGTPAATGNAGSQQTTTVIVNNHVQQNAPTVVYWGPDPSPSPPPSYNNGNTGSGRGSSRSGGAPPVGGDWPQVPSYGPR